MAVTVENIHPSNELNRELMDFETASEIPQLINPLRTPIEPLSRTSSRPSTPHRQILPFSIPVDDGQFNYGDIQTLPGQDMGKDDVSRDSSNDKTTPSGAGPNERFNQDSVARTFSSPTAFSPQPFFTTNADIANQSFASAMMPTQTCFDIGRLSDNPQPLSCMGAYFPSSPPADINQPFDNYTAQATQFTKRRSYSVNNLDQSSPNTNSQLGNSGRRRSENVEPGSARAIYLEKNRKAASKCRSKQKRQQEELVETARHVEHQNKQLKAELEFLKCDMRDLMGIVGQHSECPDTRLQQYVQREADKLVAQVSETSVSPEKSPNYTVPD